MLFEVVQYPHQSGSEVVPRVKLVPVDWDDYGYTTSFDAYVVQQPGQQVRLGQVKVLQVGSKRTSLPKTFDALDHHHGSLGQSPSYYETLERLGRMGSEIQTGLRDVTVVPPSEEILGDFGFRDSLLRSPSAQLAYDRRTHRALGSTVEFRWYPRKKILESDGITFRFDTAEPFGRVMVLVGENAAGKTDALARLALALSGARREGEIQPNPGLSRVLAVSFSAFDEFPRPKSSNVLYEYSGLRDLERDQVDVEAAWGLLPGQRKAIAEQGRDAEWRDALSCAGVDPAKLEGPSALSSKRSSTLSAGQKFVEFVFTNLVAKLKTRSLVLFDEPELHTHPRMLSGVMRALGRLLDRYDSFAVLATHSPIVLQEVPARSVRIFERFDDGPDDGVMVSKYPRESFGAPLDEIVRFGFRVNAEERNFHQRLEQMMKEDGKWTREDVEAVLQEPLSLSSRLLVEQIRSRSS
jgi:hypothetical protein